MKGKSEIGKLVSFKFDYVNTQEEYSGYVVDYNDDWTLLKYNPVDYVIDGYIILKNKYVAAYKREDEEAFRQKVLDLKGNSIGESDKIPLDDISTILNYLTTKFRAFQFDLKSDQYVQLGRVDNINGTTLTIDFLDSFGKWDEKRDFKLGNIRTIQFNTDYINSLLLVADTDEKEKHEHTTPAIK